MSRVSYNQAGYNGVSMSVRACKAYEDGEMPASKWTKKAMVAAIEDYLISNNLTIDGLSKMTKAAMFESFFTCSSWHHTGMYANRTDFYSINESAVEEVAREYTAEEIAAQEAAWAAEKAAKAAKAANAEAFTAAHRGISYDDINDGAKLFAAYPELFTDPRPSKKGNATFWSTPFTCGENAVTLVLENKSGRMHFSQCPSRDGVVAVIDAAC